MRKRNEKQHLSVIEGGFPEKRSVRAFNYTDSILGLVAWSVCTDKCALSGAKQKYSSTAGRPVGFRQY